MFSNVFTFQWTPWFICWFQVHLDEFLFSPPGSLFVCLPDRNQFKKYHFFLLFFYLSHRKWEFLFSMTPLFFFVFLVFHFTWNSFFDPFFICAVWSPFYDVGWLWLFHRKFFFFSLNGAKIKQNWFVLFDLWFIRLILLLFVFLILVIEQKKRKIREGKSKSSTKKNQNV